MTFAERFRRAATGDDPQSLQLLFFDPPEPDAEFLANALRAIPGLESVRCEISTETSIIGGSGPKLSHFGLVEWDRHSIKFLLSPEPMPYGPVESCVGPALIPPPMKVDAKQHQGHALLYYAGGETDPMERFAALCAVAGALARLDGIAVLNEEARSAVPAFDLIPDDGENALETYRNLPIPYLLGGFTKMEAGDAARPWVRTFANHRLNLPNLARHLNGHGETAAAFQLFAGMSGYLRTMGESFTAGDVVDLGDGAKLRLREPSEVEWFLDSNGPMLVIEPEKSV